MGANYRGQNFKGQRLPAGRGSDFSGAKLQEAEFHEADFRGSRFDDADLTEARGFGADLTGASFRRARLVRADANGWECVEADLSEADLSDAKLYQSRFKKASLVKANLRKADVFVAGFEGADLRQADFTGAFLVGARFPGANVAGADFSGCDFFGVDIEGADFTKAKGAKLPPAFAGKSGEAVKAFADAASAAGQMIVDFDVHDTIGTAKVKLVFGKDLYVSRWDFVHASGESRGDGGYTRFPPKDPQKDAQKSLMIVAHVLHMGRVAFDSIATTTSKSRIKGGPLERLVRTAVAEAFGVDAPAPAKPPSGGVDAKTRALAPLRAGDVAAWNRDRLHLALGDDAPKAPAALAALPRPTDFRSVTLAGLDLSGADLSELDLRGANFEGARLERALLSGANLEGANLKKTNLRSAVLVGARLAQADLSGAVLAGADLRFVELFGTDLAGADFTDANLHGSVGASKLKSAAKRTAVKNPKRAGAPVLTLKYGPTALAFAPTGRKLVVVGDGGATEIVDLEKLRAPKRRRVAGFSAQLLQFDSSGAAIAVASPIKRLDIGKGKVTKKVSIKGRLDARKGFRLLHGDRIAMAASSMSIDSIDLVSGRQRDIYKDYNVRIIAADASPNGRHVAFNRAKGVYVRSFATGEQVKALTISGSQAHSISFSPDSSLLACGTNEGNVDVFVTGTWERCATLKHCATVEALAFSPSGRRLASAASDIDPRRVAGGVRVWDLATMSLATRIEWDYGMADKLSFSADETLLAVGEWDNPRAFVFALDR